jgi:hypothetical protein
MRAHILRQARRKHQYFEHRTLARFLVDLVNSKLVSHAPVALALFREVVGGSMLDEEIRDGSNKPLDLTDAGFEDSGRTT